MGIELQSHVLMAKVCLACEKKSSESQSANSGVHILEGVVQSHCSQLPYESAIL